jgi:hypothetical protein
MLNPALSKAHQLTSVCNEQQEVEQRDNMIRNELEDFDYALTLSIQ